MIKKRISKQTKTFGFRPILDFMDEYHPGEMSRSELIGENQEYISVDKATLNDASVVRQREQQDKMPLDQ